MGKNCRLRGNCPINRFTRTQCRACRLAQCFKAGMHKMGKKKNPSEDQHPFKITEEEVDKTRATMSSSSPHISKQACLTSVSTNPNIKGSQLVKCIRIAVIKTTPQRTKQDHVKSESPKGPWVGLPKELNIPTVTVTCSFIPEKLLTTLNLAAEAVFPKIAKQILEPLISMDLFALSRVKEGHRAWYPNQYSRLLFQFYESIVKEFLGCWLSSWPSFLADHTNQVSTTLCGLVLGLEQCFAHRGFYEQIMFSEAWVTPSIVRQWGNMYPMEEDFPGITMEGTENLASPWARHLDDEHFVSESVKLLADVVSDDPVIAKLLTFLAFFSSNRERLTCKSAQDLLGSEKSQIQEQLVHHLNRQGRSPIQVDEILHRMTEVGKLLLSSCLLNSGDDAPCEDWKDIQL